MTGSAIINNVLASFSGKVDPQIVGAIKQASARTGVDFAYLMEQANAESSFDAGAEAATSSAAGLYQFIESTWLRMVRDHGHKHGLKEMAAQVDSNGKVADPAAKQEILALRKDPQKAAALAAEFAAGNKAYLEKNLDEKAGDVGPVELYLAHFLGAGGAAAFLNAKAGNELATAADIFPKAARANRNVFYDRKTGQARTLAGVCDFFEKKFNISTQAPDNKPVSLQPDTQRSQIYLARRALSEVLSNHDAVVRDYMSRMLSGGGNRSGFLSGFGGSMNPSTLQSPVEVMLLAQLSSPGM